MIPQAVHEAAFEVLTGAEVLQWDQNSCSTINQLILRNPNKNQVILNGHIIWLEWQHVPCSKITNKKNEGNGKKVQTAIIRGHCTCSLDATLSAQRRTENWRSEPQNNQ